MNNSKLLLIEGTAGVGKSALTELLFKKYIEEEKRKVRSMLHLDQAYTYHPLHPDLINNPLTKEENLQHLDTIFQMLSWYANYVPEGTPHQFYCIIETLHITQCFRPGVLRLRNVLRFDQQLSGLPRTATVRGRRHRAAAPARATAVGATQHLPAQHVSHYAGS